MQSNYKPIGNFIHLVDERNKELKVTRLLGLSISKEFIRSVANTVGTDMRNYKIIRKNQFACSTMQVRRDRKMPVALLTDFDKAIISQVYPIFEIRDETLVLPEFLMMWFSREEFDRQAEFLAVGGVRGTLEWEDFLAMELPIPSIEKQQEIVKEYNVVKNRIALNEQLNQNLEETAQALYKHWFVDFEFPVTKESHPELVSGSQPVGYKSAGGNMIYNEELDNEIPEGWEVELLSHSINIKHGFAFKGEHITEEKNKNILLTPGNFKIGGGFKLEKIRYYNGEFPEEYTLQPGDVIVTMTDLSKKCDTLGYPALIPETINKNYLHNQRLGKLEIKQKFELFFYFLMTSFDYRNWVVGGATGTTVKHTSPNRITSFLYAKPKDYLTKNFIERAYHFMRILEKKEMENIVLMELQYLLLSKMATVGSEEKINI